MMYQIVSSGSAGDLEKAVNSWLGLGWKLVGGISASEKVFFQAMIKE